MSDFREEPGRGIRLSQDGATETWLDTKTGRIVSGLNAAVLCASKDTGEDDEECDPVVRDALLDAGWPNPVVAPAPPVLVVVPGEDASYQVELACEPDPPAVTCIVSCLDAELFVASTELYDALNRANRALRVGSFELDITHGDVLFRTGLPLHDCSVGTEALELLAFMGVGILERFLPAFVAVADGECTPEQAICDVL